MLNKKLRKSKFRKSKLRAFTGIVFLPALALIVFLDFTVSKNAGKAIGFGCKELVTSIISEEITNCLENENIDYSSLCSINSENGKLSYAEIKAKEINKINAQLISSITKRLKDAGENSLKIPLGSLMGSPLLSGRGPLVAIKFFPTGVIKTKMISSFQSAGINHVNHRIYLDLNAEVTAYLFFHSEQYEINGEFLIAETLISGEVPQYYTNIISEDEKLISDIRDEMPEAK